MPSILGVDDEANMFTKTVADIHYVNTSGDTMNGVLNMASNKITGLPTPTGPTDAVSADYIDRLLIPVASKTYVDNKLDSYFISEAEGLTFKHAIDMQFRGIINVGAPRESNDVATKEYVDNQSSSLVMDKTYGFQYTVTPQNSTLNLEVRAPPNVDPNQIMMVITRPTLRDLFYVQRQTGGRTTKVIYRLVFGENMNQRITISGIVFILKNPVILISDNDNVIDLTSFGTHQVS